MTFLEFFSTVLTCGVAKWTWDVTGGTSVDSENVPTSCWHRPTEWPVYKSPTWAEATRVTTGAGSITGTPRLATSSITWSSSVSSFLQFTFPYVLSMCLLLGCICVIYLVCSLWPVSIFPFCLTSKSNFSWCHQVEIDSTRNNSVALQWKGWCGIEKNGLIDWLVDQTMTDGATTSDHQSEPSKV